MEKQAGLDGLLKTIKDFASNNKEMIIGGLAGSGLGALGGYNLVDDYGLSEDEAYNARLRGGIIGGLTGLLGGGLAGHLIGTAGGAAAAGSGGENDKPKLENTPTTNSESTPAPTDNEARVSTEVDGPSEEEVQAAQQKEQEAAAELAKAQERLNTAKWKDKSEELGIAILGEPDMTPISEYDRLSHSLSDIEEYKPFATGGPVVTAVGTLAGAGAGAWANIKSVSRIAERKRNRADAAEAEMKEADAAFKDARSEAARLRVAQRKMLNAPAREFNAALYNEYENKVKALKEGFAGQKAVSAAKTNAFNAARDAYTKYHARNIGSTMAKIRTASRGAGVLGPVAAVGTPVVQHFAPEVRDWLSRVWNAASGAASDVADSASYHYHNLYGE